MNWRRDVELYARLVIYELMALFPASIFVVPYETLRDSILGGDIDIFYNGRVRGVVIWYVR